jgi:hypothetical protein
MPGPAKNTQIRGRKKAELLFSLLPSSEMVLRIMGANLSPLFSRCQQKEVLFPRAPASDLSEIMKPTSVKLSMNTPTYKWLTK